MKELGNWFERERIGADLLGMPARFVTLDRDPPLFLPCDLREWVPAAHLVHFSLAAAEQIPTAHFRLHHRDAGS